MRRAEKGSVPRMLRVVPASEERIGDWLAFRKALYSPLEDAFHEAEMRQILASAEQDCFLALDESGVPLGFVELSLRNFVDGCLGSPVGYVEGLYVVPEARGRGIGRLMLRHAMAWSRERGCRDIAADAQLADEPAQRFWGAVGFRETFRIVEFKKRLGRG